MCSIYETGEKTTFIEKSILFLKVFPSKRTMQFQQSRRRTNGQKILPSTYENDNKVQNFRKSSYFSQNVSLDNINAFSKTLQKKFCQKTEKKLAQSQKMTWRKNFFSLKN